MLFRKPSLVALGIVVMSMSPDLLLSFIHPINSQGSDTPWDVLGDGAASVPSIHPFTVHYGLSRAFRTEQRTRQ